MNKILVLLFLSGLSLLSCDDNDNQFEFETSMVDVGGYNLNTLTSGLGANTIVFEAGLGDGGLSWFVNDVFEIVAQTNQSISYNRAGYAPSEAGAEPRSLVQLSAELHEIILGKALNDKVVLVGHSLGGAIIRYYAIEHPEKIKALLFIDPTHEDYKIVTQSEEDEIVQSLIDVGQPEVAKEAGQLIEDLNILDGLPNLPDVPIKVLTSVKLVDNLTIEDRQDWSNAHSNLGEGIDNFMHVETENSGHYIHRDEPKLVLNSINELLNE